MATPLIRLQTNRSKCDCGGTITEYKRPDHAKVTIYTRQGVRHALHVESRLGFIPTYLKERSYIM